MNEWFRRKSLIFHLKLLNKYSNYFHSQHTNSIIAGIPIDTELLDCNFEELIINRNYANKIALKCFSKKNLFVINEIRRITKLILNLYKYDEYKTLLSIPECKFYNDLETIDNEQFFNLSPHRIIKNEPDIFLANVLKIHFINFHYIISVNVYRNFLKHISKHNPFYDLINTFFNNSLNVILISSFFLIGGFKLTFDVKTAEFNMKFQKSISEFNLCDFKHRSFDNVENFIINPDLSDEILFYRKTIKQFIFEMVNSYWEIPDTQNELLDFVQSTMIDLNQQDVVDKEFIIDWISFILFHAIVIHQWNHRLALYKNHISSNDENSFKQYIYLNALFHLIKPNIVLNKPISNENADITKLFFRLNQYPNQFLNLIDVASY